MIVGDVRSEECLDLPGLATIHANSARELPHRGMCGRWLGGSCIIY
jgi:hypothetical protein